MALDWLEQEKGSRSLKKELQRLKRRAIAHPFRVLLLTILLASAALFMKERRKAPYRAYVMLRVTEGDVISEESPLAKKRLDEYMRSVALSNHQLSRIIEKHNLYPLSQAGGEAYQIDELRSNMSIKISNNYFSQGQQYDQTARTARITIRMQDPDPEVAFAVASDLANTMVENEQRRRNEAAKQLALIAEQTHDKAQKRTLELKAEVTRKRLEVQNAVGDKLDQETITALRVDFDRLQRMYKAALNNLSRIEGQWRIVDLLLAADQADLGLRFEVVDQVVPVPRDPRTGTELAFWWTSLFLALLPLAAIGVGAFDSRLYLAEDVVRLGLPFLGQVPAFPGSRTGDFRSRGRKRPPLT